MSPMSGVMLRQSRRRRWKANCGVSVGYSNFWVTFCHLHQAFWLHGHVMSVKSIILFNFHLKSLYSTDLFLKVTYRIEGLSFAGELETSPQTLHSFPYASKIVFHFGKQTLHRPNNCLSFKNFSQFFGDAGCVPWLFQQFLCYCWDWPRWGVSWVNLPTLPQRNGSFCFARWATSPPSLSHPEGFSFC